CGLRAAVARRLARRAGFDPDDPQRPEVPLAVAPVTVGVRIGLHHLLFGAAIAGVLLPAIALGPLENRAALLVRVHRALEPRHLAPSLPASSFLTSPRSPAAISTGFPCWRLRFA